MNKLVMIMGVLCGMVLASGNVLWANDTANDAQHRIGAGLHYWGALKNIDVENVDKSGMTFIVSYQHQIFELFRLETDLELFGKGYAGATQTVLSPQAYVLIGRGLYGGAGVGINYAGGDFAKNPFFALRAGIDLEIFPSVFLDLHANYRFEKWDFASVKTEAIDTDVITVGAIVRLAF